MSYDCIVIGLGGFGSATLYQLASRGLNVLGIEQFGIAHDRGSSHGESRIIRKAYFEHPDYVPLLHRAYELWADLERESGNTLCVKTGLILSGPPDGEAVAGALRSAQRHQLAVTSLSSTEAGQTYPRFRFPEDHHVVVEDDAGFLLVEACVRTCAEMAVNRGAVVRWDETVRDWGTDSATAWIETDAARYEAANLVFTGGAWMSRLLPDALPPLRVLRKVQFWYPLGTVSQQLEASAAFARIPAFFFEMPEGAFYGIPAPDGRTVKLAQHSGGSETADPSTLDRSCCEDDRAPVRRFLQTILPGITAEPSRYSVCMYTMSPDGHFIVDRHPEHRNILFAAGFSGHGFKFTPVIGAALADLVTDGCTKLPVGFLSASRFK